MSESQVRTKEHGHIEAGHGHHEEHHDSFITKYIFSQDHKIIARQFLITGISSIFFFLGSFSPI